MAVTTSIINFGPVSARRATSFVDVDIVDNINESSYLEAFSMVESTDDHKADVSRLCTIEYIAQYLSPTKVRIFGTVTRGHTYGDRKVRLVTL
jgi:hypothetical protein